MEVHFSRLKTKMLMASQNYDVLSQKLWVKVLTCGVIFIRKSKYLRVNIKEELSSAASQNHLTSAQFSLGLKVNFCQRKKKTWKVCDKQSNVDFFWLAMSIYILRTFHLFFSYPFVVEMCFHKYKWAQYQMCSLSPPLPLNGQSVLESAAHRCSMFALVIGKLGK